MPMFPDHLNQSAMESTSAAKSRVPFLLLVGGLALLGVVMAFFKLFGPSYKVTSILQSPAGSHDLIYCRDGKAREVVSYNLQSGQKTVLGHTSVLIDPYVRLPNEEGWLGDVYSNDGRSQIYILDKSFQPVRKVIDSQLSDTMPSFIGRSRQFLFWRARQSRSGAWQDRWTDFDLFSAALDNAKPKLILATNVSDISSISSNPSGSKVVYSTRERMDRNRVYVLDLKSKEQIELLPTSRYNMSPAYSADGSRVVFASDRKTEFKAELYTMTDSGGGLKQVTSLNRRCWQPAFLGRTHTIAFLVDESELWICNEDGTGLKRIE